jgi:capsid protein
VRKRGVAIEYERIPAYGEESGMLMAFMVYGSVYRLGENRGMPLIGTVLETLKKLERYKEATVGSAEERQKIPFTIEHGINSTGENPLTERLARITGGIEDDIPTDINGEQLADKIAVSTNKTVFNMPNDSRLVALHSQNELYFKDFFNVNFDHVCAAIGIPPEVARSKYDSNFSASRAAIKDWENTVLESREDFSFQLYQPVYNLFLYLQILLNKVQAPGYLEAKANEDEMILEAYQQARFVGASVPHIDPMKEVQAERMKLGPSGAHLPMTTLEAATEAVNGGESDSNVAQFAEELKVAERSGIKPQMQEPAEEKPPKRSSSSDPKN